MVKTSRNHNKKASTTASSLAISPSASSTGSSTLASPASFKGPKECLFPNHNNTTDSNNATNAPSFFNKQRSSTLSTIETTGSDEEPWEADAANASSPLTPEFHSWDDANVRQVEQQWHLNAKQCEALRQFHQATLGHIGHWKHSPHTACQFLREHKFHVKKAVTQFERMLAWRAHHQVDTILDPNSSNYFVPHPDYQSFPQAILEGLDKQGNPIYLERTGAARLWELWDRHGEIPTVQASIWTREVCTRGAWVRDYERAQGQALMGTTALVDLQGLTSKHASRTVLHLVKDGTQIIQDNWPCEAKRVIIIRAPFLFRFVWNFLKPFLTETVKEMIVLCTAADPLPELERYIDLAVLPPCINPETGQGRALPEFGHVVWEGGPLPSLDASEATTTRSVATTIPDSALSVTASSPPAAAKAVSTRRKSRNGSSVTITNLGHGKF